MLRVENISKTFNPGTITEKIALSDVSLRLNPGDFVTVIGGNGAGKSTLMNSIAGAFLVDTGKIIIDNNDITKWPEHKRAKFIGRVFQDPMMGTAAGMMIEENLAIASRRGKTPSFRWSAPKSEREKFRELLKSLNLGLENRLENKVGLLSGGQRQALTLLMATMADPKLLLLDEHTAALDPKTAEKVLAITENIISDRSLTTLMITHNMRDALRFGNRLIMMYNGKIIIDVSGKDKKDLEVQDLLEMFEKASGSEMDSDRMLLG
ncbi:ABC transporter ATP-binding protein [Pectinatus haikarae]|uniref:ABC transport system ATP-binding protein n=1 Tax=Pectinatus haikarae TaxID=349096 RepID=A0ABT9Y7P7_9FIRM|nr:ABC transporter ATP-binding protein [Pectinatus haikarae]MDQ0203858.1 putative ABC transport system ATP-binding protein [Pectinatus haikarae]